MSPGAFDPLPQRGTSMNLFASSPSPERSARALDDRRLLKMTVESAQLLSTAMRERGLPAPYRPTHAHHPVTRWTGRTQGNFRWVLRHFDALALEYRRRFGRSHASARLSGQFWQALPRFPRGRRQPFVNLSNHPRVLPVTRAYRRRLNEKWRIDRGAARWTGSRPPRWAAPDLRASVMEGGGRRARRALLPRP